MLGRMAAVPVIGRKRGRDRHGQHSHSQQGGNRCSAKSHAFATRPFEDLASGLTRPHRQSFRCDQLLAASSAASAPIDRGRLREEAPQDVIDQRVIFLLEARVRNARHHREMLIGIWQPGVEREQIFEARDAVPLAPHNQRRRGNFLRVHHREFAAHVDIGAGRHRTVERSDGIGECVDDLFFPPCRDDRDRRSNE